MGILLLFFGINFTTAIDSIKTNQDYISAIYCSDNSYIKLTAPDSDSENSDYKWNTGDVGQIIILDSSYLNQEICVEIDCECDAKIKRCITLDQTQAKTSIDYAVTDPSCNGMSNGEIFVNPKFLGLPKVQWNDGFEGSYRTNLAAGSYSMIVSDEFCPETKIEIDLKDPKQLKAAVNINSGLFKKNEIQVSGGTYPYYLDTTPLEDINLNALKQKRNLRLSDNNGCEAKVRFKKRKHKRKKRRKYKEGERFKLRKSKRIQCPSY